MEEKLLINFHKSRAKKIFYAKAQRKSFDDEAQKKVEEKIAGPAQNPDLIALLLSAPTYSKKQLDEIAKTRKAINQWRTE